MTLPDFPCINCRAEQLRIIRTEQRHEEGSDPPLWVATTLHVASGFGWMTCTPKCGTTS